MSTSLVGAAVAGLFVGVGATLALSPKSKPAPPPPTTKDPSQSQTFGGPSGPPGAPPTVWRGGLTQSDVAGEVLQPGAIGPVSDFLKRAAYITAYDRRNRIPAWTAEHLTAASLRKPDGATQRGDRQNSVFKEDESIPYAFRAHLLDYFKSGYDRGHMVPAADAKSSQQAMDETFLLSNIAPQVGEGFNRHYWAYLEAFCRDLTKSFEDVYVFTVPLFLPRRAPDGKWRVEYEVIAAQNQPPTIAVPTHFAKVVLASRPPKTAGALALVSGKTHSSKEWSLGAFVLPNAVIPDQARLESFVVPVESVESSAGLTLFPQEIKSAAKPLCSTVACQVVVRRFDDASKNLGGGGKGGGRSRSPSV